MALTLKQMQNLHKLDAPAAIEILHVCAERLGAVTVDEYCRVMCCKKRAVYYAISQNRLPYVEISGCKFPVINYI